MTTFQRHLARQLEQEKPGWQENSTILLDNARLDTNAAMKARLANIRLPITCFGPNYYASAPAELVYAALKLGDLDPARLPTGKK